MSTFSFRYLLHAATKKKKIRKRNYPLNNKDFQRFTEALKSILTTEDNTTATVTESEDIHAKGRLAVEEAENVVAESEDIHTESLMAVEPEAAENIVTELEESPMALEAEVAENIVPASEDINPENPMAVEVEAADNIVTETKDIHPKSFLTVEVGENIVIESEDIHPECPIAVIHPKRPRTVEAAESIPGNEHITKEDKLVDDTNNVLEDKHVPEEGNLVDKANKLSEDEHNPGEGSLVDNANKILDDQHSLEECNLLGDAHEILEDKVDKSPIPDTLVYRDIVEKDVSEAKADGAIGAEMVGIRRVFLRNGVFGPKAIIIPEEWNSAAREISEEPEAPILVVCGTMNTGKSTFAKYLVNRLLEKFEKVGFLDTDLGQPEFTPPGCLSLHILREPIPDLSVLCLRTPERCYFYGDVSPKIDPVAYLHKILHLYDHFRSHYYDSHISDKSEAHGKLKVPLVVNTMGWVKGVGYDILVDMLRYMVPTHVVQIRLSACTKNLPVGAFWSVANENGYDTKLMYLGTAMRDDADKSIVIQKNSSEIRELRMVAYFRQMFLENAHIATYKELAFALAFHPPYQVSMHDIKVTHVHCKVPDTELLFSLNGSLVGLAIDYNGEMSNSLDSVCVGLGIVRGIDVSKGLYYILTPVPFSTLQNVNVFLQGFLGIPSSLLEVKDFSCPYLSSLVISKKGTGSTYLKPRKRYDKKRE